MGTRGLVHIKEGKKTLVTIYRQYDCYELGMGQQLADLLGNSEILNGYGMQSKAPAQFNGAGCLAAYLVGELKENKIGNTYIFPTNTKGTGEEYVYTISVNGTGQNAITIKVQDVYENKIIYNGSIKLYAARIKKLAKKVKVA